MSLPQNFDPGVPLSTVIRDARHVLENGGELYGWVVPHLLNECERMHGLINSPELEDFLHGVKLEAVHQVQRWGEAHDRSKSAENWFWLVGYLAGKALRAATTSESLPRYKHLKRGTTYEVVHVGEDENNRGRNLIVYRGEDDGKVWVRPAAQFFDGRFVELPRKPAEKALHHCISAAAALFNWHNAIKRDTSGAGVGQDPDLVALDAGVNAGEEDLYTRPG